MSFVIPFLPSAIEMHHQQGDVSRGDTADAAGLGEVGGLDSLEFFAGFGAELHEAGVVETTRDSLGGEAVLALDLDGLAGNIAGVF